MKKVVSVSLGSSDRDKVVEITIFGEPFWIGRIGTDGSLKKAVKLIKSLDGKVDAIGLGGIDRYLVAGGKRYEIKQAKKMALAAKKTPVVDGSGLKHSLEPYVLNYLEEQRILEFKGKKVLLVSAVDRFGMAETFPRLGCEVIYGDLIFALGIPVGIFSLRSLKILAKIFLPILCWLPISLLYPTGTKQKRQKPKGKKFFEWADIIAGDFHFIRRYIPERLDGKVIITNTITQEDVEFLKNKGVKLLVTTTPDLEGRSFGTNVVEGVLVALVGAERPLTSAEYLREIQRIGWKPKIEKLN